MFYFLTSYPLQEVTNTLTQLQELISKGILDEHQKTLVKNLMDCIAQCNQVQMANSKLPYENWLKSLLRLSSNLCVSENTRSSGLLQDYLRLKKDSALSDFFLSCQGETFRLHSCILFAASEFFQTMFSFQKDNSMTLPLEVGAPILRTVVNFFYRGSQAFREVPLSLQGCRDLLVLLNYF